MRDEPIKSPQTVSADGRRLVELIDGVQLRDAMNIPSRVGVTTEVYDERWDLGQPTLRHISHVLLRPGAVSQWNLHEDQDDYVFGTQGMIRATLYDDRDGSPTRGKANVVVLTPLRPVLLKIPRNVWHGVRNIGEGYAAFINFIDNVYAHESPDEWRLPPDTENFPVKL